MKHGEAHQVVSAAMDSRRTRVVKMGAGDRLPLLSVGGGGTRFAERIDDYIGVIHSQRNEHFVSYELRIARVGGPRNYVAEEYVTEVGVNVDAGLPGKNSIMMDRLIDTATKPRLALKEEIAIRG